MKDSRIGESLWFLSDSEKSSDGSILFYTEEHVDLDHDVVRRALASTLQREGIALSLSQGFLMIDESTVTQGYAGASPLNDDQLVPCDENGETEDGYVVPFVIPATWVRVYDF